MTLAFPKPKDQRRKRHDVVDGIRYIVDKVTGATREVCLTSDARERRRREIYERDGGRCVKCRRRVDFDAPQEAVNAMHWNHRQLRKMGGGWRDDSLKNGETLCRDCHHDEHN